jgi:tripartite-type tricarboxylate transporter receptor subunit TctC
MATKRVLLGSLLALPALLPATRAAAQEFPARQVRLVVPFPPGGSTDITARLFAQRLQQMWGQAVVVDNRPGGDTLIGTGAVVQAPADGHTVLIATSALPITAAVKKSLPYDVQRDLAPVTLIGTIPNVLVVHPSVAANSVAEFVALAKSRPGALNFASAGASTGQRFAFELLKQRLGINVVHVPFRGGAPATQAVLGGQVESMIINVLEAVPLVQAGRLRALAVTTKDRVPSLPEVPTLAETVMPGLDVTVWQAAFVPSGSPAAAVARLNRDMRAVAAEPAVAQRLQELGMAVRTGTPEELATFLRTEVETWTRVAREAGIQED